MKPYLDKRPIIYIYEHSSDHYFIIYKGKNEDIIEIKTPSNHIISVMPKFFENFDEYHNSLEDS
jgi:hypothetical protein